MSTPITPTVTPSQHPRLFYPRPIPSPSPIVQKRNLPRKIRKLMKRRAEWRRWRRTSPRLKASAYITSTTTLTLPRALSPQANPNTDPNPHPPRIFTCPTGCYFCSRSFSPSPSFSLHRSIQKGEIKTKLDFGLSLDDDEDELFVGQREAQMVPLPSSPSYPILPLICSHPFLIIARFCNTPSPF